MRSRPPASMAESCWLPTIFARRFERFDVVEGVDSVTLCGWQYCYAIRPIAMRLVMLFKNAHVDQHCFLAQRQHFLQVCAGGCEVGRGFLARIAQGRQLRLDVVVRGAV